MTLTIEICSSRPICTIMVHRLRTTITTGLLLFLCGFPVNDLLLSSAFGVNEVLVKGGMLMPVSDSNSWIGSDTAVNLTIIPFMPP